MSHRSAVHVVDRNRGHQCGTSSWLARKFDPTLNGNLHYPNDVGRSINEAVTDEILERLGGFLHVSLIVIIKGRSPMEVSLIVIIKEVSD